MRRSIQFLYLPNLVVTELLIHNLSATSVNTKMIKIEDTARLKSVYRPADESWAARGLFMVIALIVSLLSSRPLTAQDLAGGTPAPSVLIVTAHPDDDALFAASVYRLAVELGGKVDLALMTDGAGGYRFSTLSEPIYNLELTNPAVAREFLPGIRKKELMAGGKIVGIRNYHFFDQPDTGYTQNPDSILGYVWNTDLVEATMISILESHRYDFIFTMLPRADTHAHHKSAAMMALRTVAKLAEADRPIVLGAWIGAKDAVENLEYSTLTGYPETSTTTANPLFFFDRTQPLGLDGRLDYRIIVNWLIAEHKSQGTMQLLMNRGEVEAFWLFSLNAAGSKPTAERLFERLNTRD